ncbi:hypothetical protein [Vibrio europaeus]|uniref:hypothetical protein n=1 Tax=Vibrio europaeus TaxID=300876 RepID=UPI00148E5104|nr:hypothetical protein [Vibrio europaeus]NOH22293.1 hypothetical protein [Vibrio europaeus]
MKQLVNSVFTFKNKTLNRRQYLGLMVLNLVVCQLIVLATVNFVTPRSHMAAFTLLLVPYSMCMIASFAIVSARLKAAFKIGTASSLAIQGTVLVGSAIHAIFGVVSLLLGLALLFMPTKSISLQANEVTKTIKPQKAC